MTFACITPMRGTSALSNMYGLQLDSRGQAVLHTGVKSMTPVALYSESLGLAIAMNVMIFASVMFGLFLY